MKSFLAITILIFACAAANAQARGDTCAGCSERAGSQSQPNPQDQWARDAAGHNDWPIGPHGAKFDPSAYGLFITNFQLNNDSEKAIREIKWTATLINRETQEEI